ncbi:UNVERIFIED_ORG: hypothetical protein J2W65_000852 [Pseudomonas parafulva]|uniref:hypothetical protein n=1 Tax=Pseudomonas TaxID=286 RepID=UPI00048C0144|nr:MULTISPECIES: hypothetical protein [Pseudomonas]MDP9555253.1 hypothetical protein [Pseudomonas parafulva]MDP9662866.1 hypothetical protein [Pseudomonas cremoricolorata]AVF54301.1 hypothetical protein AL527_03445 [Pseudomonas fulva]MBA1205852.1 hypothetical protein [Pseudomonas fulva]MBA1215359.1 hypothetical protein [Pseudomonas fulva]
MDLVLVASLLRRGRQLAGLSDGMTLLALGFGLVPLLGAALSPWSLVPCLLLIGLGMLHKYWAIRVALDADLFAHLANSQDLAADTQALDRALFDHGLKPQPVDARTWPVRSRAALALLRRQGLCLGLQLTVALATLLILSIKG